MNFNKKRLGRQQKILLRKGSKQKIGWMKNSRINIMSESRSKMYSSPVSIHYFILVNLKNNPYIIHHIVMVII
jgi:hypothetical protein